MPLRASSHAHIAVRRLRLLLLVVAGIALPAQLWSQTIQADPFEELDYYKMQHVQELVSLELNDSIPADAAEGRAMQQAEEEKDRRRLHALRTEPGLGPYLTALAGNSFIQKKGTGNLPRVFEAMAMRQDTEPSVIQHYVQLSKTLLDKDPKKLDFHECDLLLGIPRFLSLNATPENESLLIKLMKLGEARGSIRHVLMAAEALGKIGTANRSLPAMEAALRWIQLRRRQDEPLAAGEAAMKEHIKALHIRTSGISPNSV